MYLILLLLVGIASEDCLKNEEISEYFDQEEGDGVQASLTCSISQSSFVETSSVMYYGERLIPIKFNNLFRVNFVFLSKFITESAKLKLSFSASTKRFLFLRASFFSFFFLIFFTWWNYESGKMSAAERIR